MLPEGRVAGGAPLNVAFHAGQFGLNTHLISSVGQDTLGDELLEFLVRKGVGTELILRDKDLPTGTVMVTLDAHGSPSYEIVEPVAWDNITIHEEARDLLVKADALVFGTLACRSERNRQTLFEYLKNAAIRVLDVNLRPPFYSRQLLEALMKQADIVKVNEDELSLIADFHHFEGNDREKMKALRDAYNQDLLIMTKGKDGAVCLDDQGFFEESGFPVTVKDSVGSGDSFLAAFLSHYLRGAEIAECLAVAGAVGALVATHAGGTPWISQEDIDNMLKTHHQ